MLRPAILLLVLSLLPRPGAAAVEPGVPPLTDRCIHEGPRLEEDAARAAEKLGKRGGTAAIRRLLDLGAPGCEALSAWLEAGAPGATRRDLQALARPLARGGDARQLDALFSLLDRGDPAVTSAVLEALAARLPRLDEDAARRLAELDGPAAIPALGPLLGVWRRAESRRLYGERYEVEHELVPAEEPPPRHHVRAAMDLVVRNESGRLEAEASTLLAGLAREDAPGLEAWGPLLGHLLRGGTRRSRADAAFALGRIQPRESGPLLEAIRGRADLADAWLDGVAERVRAGRADGETLRLLGTIKAALPGRQGRRAEALERRILRRSG